MRDGGLFTELGHAGHGGDQRFRNVAVVDMWVVQFQLLTCGTHPGFLIKQDPSQEQFKELNRCFQ